MTLVDRIRAFLGPSPTEKSGAPGGSYNLPVTGGWLPSDYTWNWWQRGQNVQGQNRNCATVYACTAAYAQTIAACKPSHWKQRPDGGRDLIKDSPLARILRRPNGYQTRSDFILNMIQSLMYDGNVYAVAVRGGERNAISQLHLLDPKQTKPYIESETKAIFYGVGGNPLVDDGDIGDGMEMLVPQRDVLHIRMYCPRHPLIGVTPITYAAQAIAANVAINSHAATFFNNMARPSGVISTDQILNKEQIATLREAWKAQSTELNSGGVPILHGGMKFSSMSINSQDAQLVGAFHLTVEDIARAFRVPLPLAGDYQHATFTNVEQLISSWLATGLGFVVEHIENAIGDFFEIKENELVNFDTDSLLRTDFQARIDGLTKSITGGLMAPNEARAKEGLHAVEYGDEVRLQAQVVPLSAASNISSTPTSPAAPSSGTNEGGGEGDSKDVAETGLVIKGLFEASQNKGKAA